MSGEGRRTEASVSQPAEHSAPDQDPQLDDFRWQSFFQRSSEPLFVLNRRGRLLFVNRAWEDLTGLPAAQARGLACTRRKPAEPGPSEQVLAHLLCPPAEVLRGDPSRTRRFVPGAPAERRWWDVAFFPFRDDYGVLAVLGKVRVIKGDPAAPGPPVPERLIALRERIAKRHVFAELSTSVPALRRAIEQARLASQTRVPVLLTGEPGTGKRWLARAIHFQGELREQTFAALDCVALPPAALTAALFGDCGLVRQAGVSTLYLKRPGHLPRETQTRLCDAIREPGDMGGPRVIGGCGADSAEEVRAGRLLEDLHLTLGTLVIALPPLRERLADLPWLVERLLERVKSDGERRIVGLTADAWELLRAYRWPGNLRELYAVLRAARHRTKGERIDAGDLPAHLRLAVRLDRTPEAEPERSFALDKVLEEAERRMILLALRKAKGNKSKAAEMLSIWRPRLLRRMEALGISEPEKPG